MNSMREVLPSRRMQQFGHLEKIEDTAYCSKYRILWVDCSLQITINSQGSSFTRPCSPNSELGKSRKK